MISTRIRPLAVGCLALLASACSTLAPAPPQTDNHQWRIEGKLGITTPDESLSGFLIWEQNQSTYSIHVSGPLGQGSTQIEGDEHQVTLTQGAHQVQSDDPNHLIYEQMGWRFPINNLKYWVVGEASPLSSAHSEFDGERLALLEQDGWEVAYFRYDAYTGLPSRLRISQGEWRFLLVIKRWSLATL